MKTQRRHISDRLRTAIKMSPIPGYELAGQGGVNRSTLSCWVNRINAPSDPKPVLALGRILDVPASECFAPTSIPPPAATTMPASSGERKRPTAAAKSS